MSIGRHYTRTIDGVVCHSLRCAQFGNACPARGRVGWLASVAAWRRAANGSVIALRPKMASCSGRVTSTTTTSTSVLVW
jgi:hypothetical protein